LSNVDPFDDIFKVSGAIPSADKGNPVQGHILTNVLRFADNLNGEIVHVIAMRRMLRMIGCGVLLWLAYASPDAMASGGDSVAAEFVGTSPCDPLPREFGGGLAATAPCHCITWQLTLLTNRNASLPATYKLVAHYGLPGKNDPNQVEDGPQVEQQGTWRIVTGTKANADAVVSQLTADKSRRSVSLVKVGEDLLHFLNPDKSLMIGNAGWNYTLCKKGAGKDQ
jgi:hypothetical protein